MEKTKSKKIYLIAMTLLLLVQIAVLFVYGSRKMGFHEDELYSYYSSNKTAGLFVKDGEWVTGESLKDELMVLPGEQFRYLVVKQMQSWDVHPPFYYYLLHTVCSLTPGVFSKWQGIAVNLAGFVLSYLLLAYVSYTTVLMSERYRSGMSEWVSFLTCLCWGFSGAIISGVMFIRMYQWLTVFVLLCLAIHIRAMQKEKYSVAGFYIPLGITVFLGFLTQYYYMIFHVFLGAGFCIYLIWKKNWKRLAAYAGVCMVSFGAALLYYPSALSHIFRGYRGNEAIGAFSDITNTWDRVQFFGELFNEYVTGGLIAVWVLAVCLLTVTRYSLKKRGRVFSPLLSTQVKLILLAAFGYFFTVAKTALLLGDTSNRYELPIYGLFVFLLVDMIYEPWYEMVPLRSERRWQYLPAGFLAALILISTILGFANGKVLFLYSEEKALAEYVNSHMDTKAVVIYDESSADHMWWLLDELSCYKEVYMVSQENKEEFSDNQLMEAEKLVVYVADEKNAEECLGRLESSCGLDTEEEQIGVKNTWVVYEVGRK